jgi:oligopeptide/dipeptide ABC transporter ATP-binding protein
MKKLLEIDNLKVEFSFGRKKLTAVDNVTLDINKGEIVGLVGESGSGKTMTALSILNLVPYPGKIKDGRIFFQEKNLLKLKKDELSKIKGSKISLIFQDPLSALNPSFRIGWQVGEIFKSSNIKISKNDLKEIIIKTFDKVYLPRAEEVFYQYPHQLSGGMRQRVIIAMSIILNPLLVLADEPTTALDVTTQNEIFNLIEELRQKNELSFLIISHDLYLIGERCDRIFVMYAGQIVEDATAEEIFNSPKHPYTIGLLQSTPGLRINENKLEMIGGEIPDLSNLPKNGCFFQNRCKYVEKICLEEIPEMKVISEGRSVKCHKF